MEITYDQGVESLVYEFLKYWIEIEYVINAKPHSSRIPQANVAIERINQVLVNLVRTYNLHEKYTNDADPWMGILAADDFVVCSTYHHTK